MNRKKKEYPDLTKRPLTFLETAYLADNLEDIERMREQQRKYEQQHKYDPNAPMSFLGKLIAGVLILAFGYVGLSLLYAVISLLF